MAFSDRVPQYRVDIGVSSATNSWVLGSSALGSGTVLRAVADPLGGLIQMPKPPLSVTITRGRTDELGQIQAGTATIVLDNGNGYLSPLNAASPYYPNLRPIRPIAVSAQFGAGPWTVLFYGYIETIEPIDNGPVDSNVTITAMDWLGKAAVSTVTATRTAESDWTRFQWAVGAIGSSGLTSSLVGPQANSDTLQNIAYTNATGTQVLQDIADATRGVVYIGRQGYITFRTRYGKFTNRGSIWTDGYTLDQAGLNPGSHVIPYLAPVNVDFTTQNLYNDIHITGSDTIEQVAQDTASQLLYGKRSVSYQYPSLLGTRSLLYAQVLLAAYKDPHPKVHTINIDGDAWAANGTVPLWSYLFNLELGDSVTLVKSQPANAGVNEAMFVEQITHTIKPDLGGHVVTLQLSDQAASGVAPWILGTSTLGHSTYIAF